MITINFCNMTFTCDKAIKGSDYVHLVDADGNLTACFEGVTDFGQFTISGGSWTTAPSNDSCELAVVGADGVIRKSTKKASDIASLQTDVSSIKNTIEALTNRNWKLLYTGNAAPGDTITVPGSTDYDVFAVGFKAPVGTNEVGVAIVARIPIYSPVLGTYIDDTYVSGGGTFTVVNTPVADNPDNSTYVFLVQYGCRFSTSGDTWEVLYSSEITSRALHSYSDPNQSTMYSTGNCTIVSICGIV